MKRLTAILLGSSVALVLFILWVAAGIQVDYSDTYHLLSNAKTIAFGGGPYDYHRFIVPAIWHAPFFLIDSFAWRLPHLFSAFVFAVLVVALYFLYRRFLSSTSAALGAFLVISTPLLLHYAPMAKEDVLALTFTVCAFAFYFRERVWVAGVFAAFAVGSRYNLVPVLFGAFLLLECRRRDWRQRILPLFILPTLLLLLFPLVVYPWIGRSSVLEAIPQFFRELAWQYQENKATGYRDSGVGFLLLKRLVGSPCLAMSVLGIFFCWRQKHRAAIPFAVWAAISLAVQLYLVPGKEGRYFFVCLPPIIYFAVRGFEECLAKRSRLGTIVVVGFLLIGGYRTLRELDKFRDPFYRRPIAKQISETAAAWAGESGGKIIWVGEYYATYPREALFAYEDDYAYIYHIHKHVVQFYTGRGIGHLSGGAIVRGKRWDDGVLLPEIADAVEKGDVLIINPEKVPVVTRTLGLEEHPPLVLQRVGNKSQNTIHYDRVRVFN